VPDENKNYKTQHLTFNFKYVSCADITYSLRS